MGQQQLLLIMVGIIVVGLCIFVGVNLAATYSEDSNRDAVLSDLVRLSSLAKAHFNRPESMGGGGNSFANFTIPEQLDTTGNGTYEIITGRRRHSTDNQIRFLGTGTSTGKNGVDPVSIEFRYSVSETKIIHKN